MSKTQAVAKKKEGPESIESYLKKMQPEIARALPRHVSPERMSRIALTEFRKNPELAACDLISFLGAVVQCSQLGLEPGGALGQIYLVPFYNKKRGCKEVQVIPGYKGLIELARRSGRITSIAARAVYDGDEFSYQYGLDEQCIHRPTTGPRGDLTHVYAVVQFKDGGRDFEVMTRSEVELVRDGLKFPNPVWKSHFDEMAKKTVIRRISKRLPLSPELIDASNLDDNYGEQHNYNVFDIEHTEPVTLASDSTTVKEVNAEMAAEAETNQAKVLFDKIEKHVAAQIAAGATAEQVEELIGIPMEKVAECNFEQLTAIWDSLN